MTKAAAPFEGSPWRDAATLAETNAPYLKRLMHRREDLLVGLDAEWPERLLREAITQADAVAADPPDIETAMRVLRRAKDATHLATAIADIGRAWPLERVTAALTDFADAALRASLAVAGKELAARGVISDPSAPGFALIAMGKMGAGELNYSSDIDFSAFFDAETFPAREPRVGAVRLVAPLVRVLEEVTPDGYVFRTDLRLRPDPGSTPVAVSIASAEHYYQSLGQNWERAAFIKARAAAGDLRCGEEFLKALEPFIWRRHLDFAAVEDVHSIKRQILSTFKSAELESPIFDVKLGRGGIRDIELFAQTQQLILGGRNRSLRKRGTIDALAALAEAGAIKPNVRDALSEAYAFYRMVEHRIQMLEDAQTHDVPRDAEVRARVAALAGFEFTDRFDAALVERRRIVSEIDRELFGRGQSLADPLGSLIFTGVEDNPETLATIGKLGFKAPAAVSQTIRGWHHGRIRAMRSERARELLTRLTPNLLRAFAGAGSPDDAFARFARFFAGLAAGVQVLALLEARPALLDLLARLLTLAPPLADGLARRPALLDAVIDPQFMAPLAQDLPGRRTDQLRQRVRDSENFEAQLNAARRFQREEAFRIDVQLLDGIATPAEAAAARTDLAQACVEAMTESALHEVERTNGQQPGTFCVLALGKFGGGELAEGSDLDVMLVYDAPDSASAPGDFYARVTQRLISALSAPTEEGALYEIDTKLRPSGSKGPVAVRLSSFERYYSEEAWTWEILALTRLRPVAGDGALGRHVAEIAKAAITRPRDDQKTRNEVADMRALMQRERPGRGMWDLKLVAGGFVDIEFIAQTLQIVSGAPQPHILSTNTGEALAKLESAGVLGADVAQRLSQAWRLHSDLSQILRICAEGAFDLATAPPPLQARLAAMLGVAESSDTEAKLRSVQAAVRADFMRIIGWPAT
ncbi:MAG TPA: bifunctional [glutamine synthetase] adenylyltransferase/[glutamine synthetase]-adenylyl-L-tyrosine phosphorylase [Vitreimonas sp.]|nr:bifunctional [glutamine synthetase] adenylyltransferase/[glutamine synthetase]-adenylyl-L-tyrosine phosphorylase [Vitreimonas sp.]